MNPCWVGAEKITLMGRKCNVRMSGSIELCEHCYDGVIISVMIAVSKGQHVRYQL
jgi:hypothetical protein